MTETDFVGLAREERLTRWLHIGTPDGASANRVCVFEAKGAWCIVITDERAGVIETSRRRFDSESSALEDALDSARMLKSLLA